MTALSYDYAPSKAYCEQIGLVWLGDDYAGLIAADNTAKFLGMNQEQVTELMELHLWQVKILFTPKNYKILQRIGMALYFLTGWKSRI